MGVCEENRSPVASIVVQTALADAGERERMSRVRLSS